MNIVFYLLILIAAVTLWFLLAFIFKPIGKCIYRIIKDALDEMKED